MTAKPGRQLREALAFVTGERDAAGKPVDPPKRFHSNASTNWHLLGRLTGVLRGVREDVDGLTRSLAVQLGDAKSRNDREHVGLYGDEMGGGYAPIQDRIILAVLRFHRGGGIASGSLVDLCRRRWGASLCLRALLAHPYHDSVLSISPAARLREPVADELSLPLQLTIGAPPRRFGVRGGSKPDAPVYFWRGADDQAADLRKLMGVMPSLLASECGVDYRDLVATIKGSAGVALSLATGLHSSPPAPLRSKFPLHIRRGDGLAAWWSEFQAHDAPVAGASIVGGRLHSLQPRPIGPNAGRDHQQWSPRKDGVLVPQHAWIDGGKLIGEFTTQAGRERAGDTGRQVETKRYSIPLPAGEPVLELLIDENGAREVRGGETPAPRPPEPPQPPRLEPPRGGDGSVQRILDAFLLMRLGRLQGGADAMERIIRGEL